MFMSFQDAGYSVRRVSVADMLRLNMVLKDVEKISRILKGYLDQNIFDDIFTAAKFCSVIPSAASISLENCLSMTEWLKKPEGKNQLENIMIKRRLVKSAGDEYSVAEISMVRLLEAQRLDRSNEVKKIETKKETAIAELMAQIEKVRQRAQRKVAKIDRRYPSAAGFPEPSALKIREVAWNLYIQYCDIHNVQRKEKTVQNLTIIGEEYRQKAIEQLTHEYCSNAAVRDDLILYGDRKIKLLKDANKNKDARRFRLLHATATGKSSAEVPPQIEKEIGDDDTHGEGEKQHDINQDKETEPQDFEIYSDDEEDGEQEAEAEPFGEERVPNQPTRTPIQERTRHGRKKRKPSQEESHSHGA
ncbi:TPA_asm: hypothetical protein [Gloriosa superba amalgavirus 1]|nr:TPA_asm: hypothetical protein [Gloriosa superba amalgavirus 1]